MTLQNTYIQTRLPFHDFLILSFFFFKDVLGAQLSYHFQATLIFTLSLRTVFFVVVGFGMALETFVYQNKSCHEIPFVYDFLTCCDRSPCCNAMGIY